MKFCYIDESGTGDEPFAVMVGVIVDAQRMRLTKNHWNELLQTLSNIVQREIPELHTRDFYAGNSPWRGIDGPQRSQIITEVFQWLADRRHHIVYSAVNKTEFHAKFSNEPFANDIGSLWRFMALHLTLAIQKNFQNARNNKGNTVLIFDNEVREAASFTQLLKSPPDWTDTYYNRGGNQMKLDQIIDVPYFVDSRDVGLIQVADMVSYFLRRYIEVQEQVIPPKYYDEEERLNNWLEVAFSRSISKTSIFLSRGRCDCADLFYRYAPQCILS